MPEWRVEHGDCRDVLADLPAESIDSALMDPPYGLGFMGAEWDKFGGGRGMKAETIARQKAEESRNEPFGRSGKAAAPAAGEKAAFKVFMGQVASATLRVLKPGAHVLVFGGTRTYHWMVDAWEDAGFEVRDQVLWLYGTGFPKNVNISKAIDKGAGVEPVARKPATLGMKDNDNWNELKTQLVMPPPTTPEAIQWDGWGTALKPAVEPLMLARKPIAQPIYRNVLEHGTGAINIDGCRVGENPEWSYPQGRGGTGCFESSGLSQNLSAPIQSTKGRHPANVILSHAPGCTKAGIRKVKSGKAYRSNGGGNTFGGDNTKPPMDDASYADAEGNEMIEAWECVSGCPISELDWQSTQGGMHGAGKKRGGGLGTGANDSLFRGPGRPDASNGTRYGDKGGASRFFYCAKPSKAEKEAGLDSFEAASAAKLTGRKEGSAGLVMQHVDGSAKANPYAGTSGAVPRKNTHPTVKPVRLLRYLSRLITPPGGTLVDPFCGSGSGGIAAGLEGFNYIGVELDPEGKGYPEIARARIRHHVGESTAAQPVAEADPMFRGF
jgi:site-specific DNA-methyltransferase (adenine-specific)